MKKIITSLGVIVAVAALAVGATTAFLSDTETSSGNTFAAGAIDLKIDNESYYNGVLNDLTSWTLADLPNGKLFFNFTDLKPDDEGEDTISLHVNDNDAYLCMDMTLTSDDDKSSNEPELDTGDEPEDVNNTWDGELADALQMFWWADDGDNVYEVGENQITPGVQTVTNMFGPDRVFSIPLADSENNIWTPSDPTPDPVPGDTTVYIAKAWCFGTLGLSPLTQDGVGTDGPLAPNRVGTGVSCDGTSLGNGTQTDGVTLDLAFRAVQSRHIPDYVCNDGEPRTATLTVNKVIVTNNGGNETINDFQLSVIGNVVTNVTSGVANLFVEGNYTVTESGVSGYQASFSGDCNAAGQITLASGDNKTCTITNDDISPSVTLIKNVVNNNGGTAVPIQFTMRIDGNVVPQNTSVSVSANSVHAISEDAFSGYTLTGVSGTGCPATLPGNVTLNEGQAITCTVTNDDDALLMSDSFGTGGSVNDIPNWEEEGNDEDSHALAEAAGTGEDSVSPNGGRFAKMKDGEWICRDVNAVGFSGLTLKYYWRGDTDAEDNESGIVEYFTGGTCDAPTGLTTLTSHELDDLNNDVDEGWSALQSVGLPGALDGTSFFIRFRNAADHSAEHFRIDGVSVAD